MENRNWLAFFFKSTLKRANKLPCFSSYAAKREDENIRRQLKSKNAGSWGSVGEPTSSHKTYNLPLHILPFLCSRDEKKTKRELNYVNVKTSRSTVNEDGDWLRVFVEKHFLVVCCIIVGWQGFVKVIADSLFFGEAVIDVNVTSHAKKFNWCRLMSLWSGGSGWQREGSQAGECNDNCLMCQKTKST